MGKRQAKDPDDDVVVIVLLDNSVRQIPAFGTDIENRLMESFIESGKVRICYHDSEFEDLPNIQWITRVPSKSGKVNIGKDLEIEFIK